MEKIIIANWKMNHGEEDGLFFMNQIFGHLNPKRKNGQIIICPPYTILRESKKLLMDHGISLCAQDCSAFEAGSHTGDISAHILKKIGVSHVLIGHSERRFFHNETPAFIHQKISMALKNDLHPILCVGETAEQYGNKKTSDVIQADIMACIQQFPIKYIAYEPLWAIGTGQTPSIQEIEQVHKFIKKALKEITKEEPHVLYGGSVNENNAAHFLSSPHVDGLLVGGASLKLDIFIKIVNSMHNC